MEQQANEGRQRGCFFCSSAWRSRVCSDTTRGHFRNSRVEFLKGLRSLIDDRITHLSSKDEPKGAQAPTG